MARIPTAILDFCRDAQSSGRLPAYDPKGPMGATVEGLLRRAHRSGALQVPAGLAGHDTLLERALRDLDAAQDAPRWYLDSLVDWMARMVALDVDSQMHKVRREDPNLAGDALARRVAGLVAERAAMGSYGVPGFEDSDLVVSRWNGKRHGLAIDRWAIQVWEVAAGMSMRLGSVRFPIEPAFVPGRVEVEMRLRTGTLFVGSDAPDQGLATLCTSLRQASDGQGLAGECAVTRSLLGDRQIVAFGVNQRSLAFVPRADGFDVVAPDEANDHTHTFTLDYRHLCLLDAHALQEFFRVAWDTPNALVEASYQRAVQAHTGSTFHVDPGRYRFTLPANHQRSLGQLPNGDILLLCATRVD